MSEIKTYKIERPDGLFSTGGTSPTFTRRGKTWSQLNHLKSHLRQFCHDAKTIDGKYTKGWWNEIPEDWTVIEIKATYGYVCVEDTSVMVNTYKAHELYPKTKEL
jgi:hypothetical protein